MEEEISKVLEEELVRKYGDPILKKKCEDVVFPDETLNQKVLSMFLVMYKMRGVGLAANQIGLSERLAVINIDPSMDEKEQVILINPTILESDGKQEAEEGCLSIPGVSSLRKRANKIKVESYDLEGNRFEFEAEDLLSIAVQHEIDHLNGKFFVDELDFKDRVLIENKLKKLARKTKKELKGS